MALLRIIIVFSMVFCARGVLIYDDTGLASQLISTAWNTTDSDTMFITIYSKAKQNMSYDQLFYAEGNNGSDVTTLYYSPQDDLVYLERNHQQTNYSRITWNLKSRGHEKFILVVGSGWLQLVANCEPLESYEAMGHDDLLTFLRNPDLETIYAEEVEIRVYNSVDEAMASQCDSLSSENFPKLPETIV